MRADKFIEELTKLRQHIIDNKNDFEPEILFSINGLVTDNKLHFDEVELWDIDNKHIVITIE